MLLPSVGIRQLEAFLIEKGNQDLGAIDSWAIYFETTWTGVDLFSIVRELGLKTMVTLEKI